MYKTHKQKKNMGKLKSQPVLIYNRNISLQRIKNSSDKRSSHVTFYLKKTTGTHKEKLRNQTSKKNKPFNS